MRDLLPFLVVGVVTGSLYGLAGIGLILTYRTSGVFNFGHGAISAAAAYLFYDLHFTRGLAWPLAALVAVVVFGGVAGVLIERVSRALVEAPDALVVVATVGLLLGINGLLQMAFGVDARLFPQFLPAGPLVTVADVGVTYAQMIVVVLAAVCAAGLYLFLRLSRTGVAMRAVVDNPALLSLTGTRAIRVRRMAWVIGSMFASLSGLLIAPTLGLDSYLLTLLIVQAFGACAIGAFSSLPLTYGGGVLVGVLSAVATKYFVTPPLNGIPVSMPFLILVAVLLIVPVRKLPTTRIRRTLLVAPRRRRKPPLNAALLAAGGAFALVVPHVVGTKIPVWTNALTMVVVFASLSLLVTTSGQISLCHTAFAAVGATTLSILSVDHGVPWVPALILAGLSAVPLGALVVIPAIRLSGVYLALATFGFAILMQNVIYPSGLMFGTLPRRYGTRPVLGFFDSRTDTGLYYLVLAVAVVSCFALITINRGRLGRLLRGMSETPTALSSQGLNVNLTRLIVFCISAFFAGIAGGLMLTQASAVSPVTFQPLQSLLWLAVLAACGTRLLRSSILAAAVLAIAPAYITGFNSEQQTLIFGLLAILAAVMVANLASLSSFVAKLAAQSEPRRQESPARYRQQELVTEVAR